MISQATLRRDFAIIIQASDDIRARGSHEISPIEPRETRGFFQRCSPMAKEHRNAVGGALILGPKDTTNARRTGRSCNIDQTLRVALVPGRSGERGMYDYHRGEGVCSVCVSYHFTCRASAARMLVSACKRIFPRSTSGIPRPPLRPWIFRECR